MDSESNSERAAALRTLEEAREAVRLGAREMYADTAPHERKLRGSLQREIGGLYSPIVEIANRITAPAIDLAPKVDPNWPPTRHGFGRQEDSERG